MRRSTRSSSTASSSQSSQETSASQKERAPRKKKTKKPPICKPTQWVAVLPVSTCVAPTEAAALVSPSSHSFIALKDPKTGSERRYLVSRDRHQICEVQRCCDEPRSWFIGDSVQTDGSLLVCTPVDPLFLALPYLSKAGKAGKFTTLEAILDNPVHTNSLQLEHFVKPEQWKHVCDCKVLPGDMTVYRYNQTKTVHWLRKRVEVLSVQLKAQAVHVGSGSHSSALVQSKKHGALCEEDYLRYACGMVCEYLTEELAASLSQSYSFKGLRALEEPGVLPPAKKRRTDSVDSGVFSQQSSLENSEVSSESGSLQLTCTPTATGSDEPLEDYTKYNASLPPVPPTKPQKQTLTQKALSKVDKKGMKSLSSFFGKTKT